MDSLSDKNTSGFTIIETVVCVAIFALISMALLTLFNNVFKSIKNNKAILAANTVALEQLEVIRGMDFDNVATDTGWGGPIASSKNIFRGGTNFTVLTDVSWMDDPYDGCNDTCGAGGTSPCSSSCTNPSNDTFSFDYKKVRIRVLWLNPVGGATSQIAMDTNIVPPGLEGLSAGKGGLYLTVFDAVGTVLPNADVYVDSASKGYSLNSGSGRKTDLNGNIWIPNLNPANDYHIRVTKAGYSASETYAVNNDQASPNYNPIPDPGHAQVLSQQVTKLGFSIDVLGSMNIRTVHFSNPLNWQADADSTGDETESCEALDASGKLFVAWADTRDGGDKHIYMHKLNYNAGSGDYLKVWGSDAKIVDRPNASSPKLKILPNGSLYALWSDDRNGIGNSEIHIQEINTANGNPMGSDYAVSHDAAGGAQRNPSMASDQDGNLYITWEDNRYGNWDVYAQKFVPSSATFWSSDLKVNALDSGDQLNSKVILDNDTTGSPAVNANNLYVIWQSNHQGNFDIFMRKFNKDGVADAAFSTEKQINTDGGSLDQYDPDITFDGSNNFYVAWSDERNSQPDIYLQKVDKDGNDKLAGDVKMNDDAFATARRVNPSIAYHSDGAIYVSWDDSRNSTGGYNVYASKINSTATRLWTYDLLLASTMTSNQTNSSTVCDSSGKAVTIWQDSRNRSDGTSDIYGANYSDMGNIVRANVPITVIGTKDKGKYANVTPPPQYILIPKYSTIFTSDGSGIINIGPAQGGMEWDSYTFSAGGGYNIISIDLPSPIVLSPGGTVNVVVNVGP